MKNKVIILLIAVIGFIIFIKPDGNASIEANVYHKLKQKAKLAQAYCKENNLDKDECILIDFSISSEKYRMFVWSFTKDTIIDMGLCTKGMCDMATKDNKSTFSNIPNSHCSSLGKYKIGNRSYSNWGINIHYKLHGLETTNSNAFKRIIVLHSWGAVPDAEDAQWALVESWGCPAVSNNYMQRLDTMLKQKNANVLLWIFK